MDLSSVRTYETDRRIRIAVDAMGGDFAPVEVVAGAVDYARSHPGEDVLLVGDEARVRELVGGGAAANSSSAKGAAGKNASAGVPANLSFVHASEVIGMDEHPARALREKKDASIVVAMDLVKRGRADVVVTAGHTGAGMAAAVLRLGRLRGVDRPALAIQMATDSGPFVFVDIGANPDSTGENLYQYAHMGSLYAERVLGVERPRVALLSIGEEKGKGDARIQRATELLDASNLHFVGNVEGKDLVHHMADVVVCDAVVGNVTIKFFEGLSGFIFDLFRKEFRAGLRGRLAYLLLRPGIARIRKVFDYERLGASPLLGVRGMVLITHGRAKRRMIYHAVAVGAQAARARIPEAIAEAFRHDAAAEPPGDAAAGSPDDAAAADEGVDGAARVDATPSATSAMPEGQR